MHSLLNKVGRLVFRERFQDQDRIRMGRRNVRNRYLMEDDQQKIPGTIIWQIFDCCEFEPPSCLLSYVFLSRSFLFLTPSDSLYVISMLCSFNETDYQYLVLTACISMAYPPRMQIPPAQNSMAAEIGPLMNEEIPVPGIHVNNLNIVHFDMDAQNIFIFNSDNNHRGVPVFKVSFDSHIPGLLF